MPEVELRQTRFQFKGTGLQAIGWGLLSLLLTALVIPAAWGATFLYRWLVRSLSFNDDTKASFEGRGKEVWWQFALLAIIAPAPQLSHLVDDPLTKPLVSLGLSFGLLLVSAELWLRVIRWVVSKIRLSFGPEMTFEGEYFPLLGWSVLYTLSSLIFIPVPWVLVAVIRWICRNIDFGRNTVRFTGAGGALLWRTIVALLPTAAIGLVGGIYAGAMKNLVGFDPGNAIYMAIVFFLAALPLPWLLVWLVKWFARNFVITRRDEEEPITATE